ncbi:MAG: hypothetical protein AAB865_01405 [Patescibacteria group bacterium]
MTISNRAKLLIAGILVIIAIILILFFWPRDNQTPTPTPTANQQTNTAVTNTAPTTPPRIITPEEKAEASAATVAKIFVERFGSYSSESEAVNLEDLLPLATASYALDLQQQIDRLRAAGPSADYYGVSTRVISTTSVSLDEPAGRATFDVVTQREEARGSVGNTSVRYQTIQIQLKEIEEAWLVDGASWL